MHEIQSTSRHSYSPLYSSLYNTHRAACWDTMQLLSNLLWLPLGLTCQDLHNSCAAWAKHGECEQNPAYMKARMHPQPAGFCLVLEARCQTPCSEQHLFPWGPKYGFPKISALPKNHLFQLDFPVPDRLFMLILGYPHFRNPL